MHPKCCGEGFTNIVYDQFGPMLNQLSCSTVRVLDVPGMGNGYYRIMPRKSMLTSILRHMRGTMPGGEITPQRVVQQYKQTAEEGEVDHNSSFEEFVCMVQLNKEEFIEKPCSGAVGERERRLKIRLSTRVPP